MSNALAMLEKMASEFAGFHVTELEGVPVLWRRDGRFKTFRFGLHARRPLDQRAAARSILPALLLQGTERDRSRPALARRMELLYGAAVLPSTTKVGETHVLRFSLDAVAGAHVPGHPDQLDAGLQFLADLLVRPNLAGEGFPEGVFRREVEHASHSVRAIFNDKAAWAAHQALAQACAGEPMAIPEHGSLEAIAALTPAEPESARRDFLRRGELWAMAYGALPEHGGLDQMARFLSELPERAPEPIARPIEVAERPRRAGIERVVVQQSKLVLVFRLPWTPDAEVWAGRILFASMLGGGPHSRLFREVREKQSLAYYAHAGLDRHKNLLMIQVGLDEGAAPRVEQEVLRQIEELSAGRFSSDELDTARAGLLSTLASLGDDIAARIEFTSRQWLLGHDRTPQQQAALYMQLKPEAVRRGASGLWLDYSYLLAPSNGVEAMV